MQRAQQVLVLELQELLELELALLELLIRRAQRVLVLELAQLEQPAQLAQGLMSEQHVFLAR